MAEDFAPRDVSIEALASHDPIDERRWLLAVRCATAGAVVPFLGIVRDHDGGRPVIELEYSAHPSAQERLHAAAHNTVETHPNITALAIVHRVGVLHVGDVALLAVVSAAHRGQAFDACRYLVERVKDSVPIWKRQTYADGSDAWVGLD